MAKQTTICERCDGKFDGTPSGWLKHQRTIKHNAAKPMAGDGVPEGFPDAFATAGPVKVADDEGRKAGPAEEPEFTVIKEEVIEATETAIEAKVQERSKPAAKAALADGLSAILAGEATAESVLADVAAAGQEPEAAVILPDFDMADLPDLPDSLSFAEFQPYTFPNRTEAVQGFAEDNAEELAAAELEVAKGKRYVRHGKLHSLKLLPKYEAQLAAAQARLEAAQLTKAGIEAYDEQRFTAWYGVAADYWNRVHAAVEATSGADPTAPFSKGVLVIEGSVPSIAFANGDVLVNGPRKLMEGNKQIVAPATVTVVASLASIGPGTAQVIGAGLAAAGRYVAAFNEVLGL